jgi:hypothetical protein
VNKYLCLNCILISIQEIHDIKTWGSGCKTTNIFNLCTSCWLHSSSPFTSTRASHGTVIKQKPLSNHWTELFQFMATMTGKFKLEHSSLLGCCIAPLGNWFLPGLWCHRLQGQQNSHMDRDGSIHSPSSTLTTHIYYITPYLACICSWTIFSWRWRHYDPSKFWEVLTQQHSITSKKTQIFSTTTLYEVYSLPHWPNNTSHLTTLCVISLPQDYYV